MITVTEVAVEAIKDCIKSDNKALEESYLRVSVRGGGCSGMAYDLSIETNRRADDITLEYDGVRILVDPKSKLFLHGLMLDYTTGLKGKGFVFSNPNAKSTCGCGESFAV